MLAAGAAVPLVGLLGRSAAAAPFAPAATVPANASTFVSIAPNRIADTRQAAETGYATFGFQRLDERTIRVQVTGRGGVPANAVAAVLNVTATNPSAPGWVKVVPTGSPPAEVSNINVEGSGQTLANLVTIQVPTSGPNRGQVDISCYDPLDVVVDVAGAYVPAASATGSGRYVGLSRSSRVLDTRDPGRAKVAAGAVQRVDLSSAIPASATAVVVNLTVTESNGPGFWTAYVPGTSVPTASNVNTDAAGQTRANQAILPIKGLAAIDVFSYSGGHLVVDVAGYFTGAAGLRRRRAVRAEHAVPRDRHPVQRRYGRMYATWVCELTFIGMGNAQAAVINLTTSETRGPGWFAAYAARTDRPDPGSNLNATQAGQTIANHAIARTSTAGIAVYTYAGGDVIVDVAGYFTGTPLTPTRAQVQNELPQPSSLPYTLRVPGLGLVGTIVEGVGDNVVNAGYVGHWPGTGLAGQDSHMVLFAHRTEHGGIFRNIHLIGPGWQVFVDGADGRRFTYEYAGRSLTGSSAETIFDASSGSGTPSLSLVACSKTNYLPTDVRYRIVVTFVQVAEA